VIALPASIDVSCTPFSQATETATLVVHGIGGATDMDTATLRCISSGGGGPVIMLSTQTISAPMTAVGMTSGPYPLTSTNTGSGTLQAQLSSGSTEWTASTCVGTPCTLAGTGANVVVNVQFSPTAYGDRSSSLLVTSNDTAGNTMLSVALDGSGSGGTIEVTDPPSPDYTIDFGTIPKGAPSQRPLSVLEMGNVGVTVSATGATTPFSITPASINLSPGTPGAIMVSCGSASAGGPYTTTINLGTTAYAQNTNQVTAKCSIADTDLEVTPATFFFDPFVRVGRVAQDIKIESCELAGAFQRFVAGAQTFANIVVTVRR